MYAKVLRHTHSLTSLFRRMRQGDSLAANQAYEAAYQELRNIAGRLVRHEYSPNVAATELVNETYLRQLRRGTLQVENRQHFYSIAANAMRHVLIDLARERKAARRGKDQPAVSLDAAANIAALASTPEEMLSLDAHLGRLEKLDPDAARTFSLRYFLGYSGAEAAELLSVDPAKLRQDWEYAKAWLRDRINQDLNHSAKRSAK